MPAGDLPLPPDADADDLPDWLGGGLPDTGLPDWLLADLPDPIPPGPDSGAPLLTGLPLPDFLAAAAVEPPPPAAEPAAPGWDLARHRVAPAPDAFAGYVTYRFEVAAPPGGPAECLVELRCPAAADGVEATRSPRRTTAGLEWDLGVLEPGARVPLAVRFPRAAALGSAPLVARVATRPAPRPAAESEPLPVPDPEPVADPPPDLPPPAPLVAELVVSVAAPERCEPDEEFACRVAVENRGTGPAAGAAVRLALPDELVFRGATEGGVLAFAGDAAEWAAGDLPAGGRWEATARLLGFHPGRVRLAVTATAADTEAATADAPLACEVRRAGGGTLAGLLTSYAPAADGAEAAAPATAAAAGERCLVVRAAGGRFALPIDRVREVLRPVPVTPAPASPGWLAGMANVRGDIVPLVDLASFLGYDGGADAGGLVVVRGADDGVLGLLVDAVAGIRPVPPARPTPVEAAGLAPHLTGVAVDAEGVLHLLDPGRVAGEVEARLTV